MTIDQILEVNSAVQQAIEDKVQGYTIIITNYHNGLSSQNIIFLKNKGSKINNYT